MGIARLLSGATSEQRLAATAAVIALCLILLLLRRAVIQSLPREKVRGRFWFDQLTRMALTLVIIAALAVIWRDDSGRFASVAALIAAGLTIALQKVVTSFAGYLSILRGNVFTVGDRITMGGVRGDVVGLSYLRTTVMEMGQPPAVSGDDPGMWVGGRQYTGRIVNITNDKVFETPIYNYTRQFPFLWDEIAVPLRYESDWQRAEEILLEAAREATADLLPQAHEALQRLLEEYVTLEKPILEPQVYLRMTDNWIELTLRFLAAEHGVRDLKNRISRQVLHHLTTAGIDIASATYEVVRLPAITVNTNEETQPQGRRDAG